MSTTASLSTRTDYATLALTIELRSVPGRSPKQADTLDSVALLLGTIDTLAVYARQAARLGVPLCDLVFQSTAQNEHLKTGQDDLWSFRPEAAYLWRSFAPSERKLRSTSSRSE